MTLWRPCWGSKQRNGSHVGGVKYSFIWGLDSIFMEIPPFVSLYKYGFWSLEQTHSLAKIKESPWEEIGTHLPCSKGLF